MAGECGETVKRLPVCIYSDVCPALMCEYTSEIALSLLALPRQIHLLIINDS